MQIFGFTFQQFPHLHFHLSGNPRFRISASLAQWDWDFLFMLYCPSLTIGKCPQVRNKGEHGAYIHTFPFSRELQALEF